MSTAPATRGADNADPGELARFGALAARWWDPEGPSRPLHELNPVRLEFVARRASLAGARVLDVGCGGGILAEALARAGAEVTALDLSPELLGVARLHLLESGLAVDYREQSIAAHADEAPGRYDVVTCMELLEHVPDPAALLADCARALRPGGALFVSTLNRTARAFALAIVGAEYLLGLLPRGTHRHAAFIRPAELARGLRGTGLELRELRGLAYSPFTRRARLVDDTSVNYLAHAVRPE